MQDSIQARPNAQVAPNVNTRIKPAPAPANRRSPPEPKAPPLPHVPNAERGVVLGLINSSVPERVFDIVKADDFFDQTNGAMFRCMRDVFQRHNRISIDAIQASWRNYKPLDGFTVGQLLFDPYAKLESPHVLMHARDVAETARKRRLTVALEDLSNRALSDDPGAIVRELRELAEEDKASTVEPVSNDYLDALRRKIVERERPINWANPCSPFAQIKLQPGRVIVIAAPPGFGKTIATQHMTFDAVAYHPELRATVVQVEMDPEELAIRHLARLSGVDASRIANRNLCAEAEERVLAAQDASEDVLRRIRFVPAPFTMERTREVARKTDSKIVVVDYCQRVPATSERAADVRQQINQTMDVIRRTANEDGRCVIVVAAVSRQKDSGGRSTYSTERLNLASLRESGELEYGADSVYLLVDDDQEPGLMKLACHKSRGEAKVDIPLRFIGNICKFENPNACPDF